MYNGINVVVKSLKYYFFLLRNDLFFFFFKRCFFLLMVVLLNCNDMVLKRLIGKLLFLYWILIFVLFFISVLIELRYLFGFIMWMIIECNGVYLFLFIILVFELYCWFVKFVKINGIILNEIENFNIYLN